MTPRIAMVSLGVRNLAAAIDFYETGLGFARHQFDADSIAFFDAGGVELALYGWEALAEDATVDSEGEGFRGVTLAYNVSSSAEVLQILDRAVAAGAKLVKAGQPVFWGGFSGYFADLDGHLWEVACGSEEYMRERGST